MSTDPSPAQAGQPGDDPRKGVVVRESAGADPTSAMTPRFNLLFRWFARRFFGHFELGAQNVARLKALEKRGSVIYVMRYSSRLDYLLFNTLFMREGLRLSSFANGIHFYYYRPLLPLLRGLFARKRGQTRARAHSVDQQWVRQLSSSGDSFFLFLRTQRLRTFWRGLLRMRHRQDELDLIQEVVREVWSADSDREVFVVPLSIFWRKGPRRRHRFMNLDYGSLSRPSDIAKVASFLATYRSLAVKIGEPIDLTGYIASHRSDGQSRVARTVRRSILIYLYREEKVVVGPTLQSPQQVLKEILADKGVRAAMRERAGRKRGSPEKAERDVEKMVREIAARMNSTLLALLATAVGAIIRRLFSTIETRGLDKVAEYAKRHPLVLVPTHRSYFDFLIVSILFYDNYLVPPHIAARDNMGFGPFGPIFRMAGAFYLRKSFDDPLYKQVFRAYVAYLVREGFTQEFFIEGGRSRTGKTLAPRLGMLTWDVDAFLECAQRDLFFVPIAITYERLVEESGMVDELEGGEKSKESTLGLLRARKYLQRRFGSVHVNFAEPVSLTDALGERRKRFERVVRGEVARLLPDGSPEEVAALAERIEEEKREFIEDLAHGLVERINWSIVSNATSIVSAVLMGQPSRGVLRTELVERAGQIVELLRIQGALMTSALRADRDDFADSIAFMLRADLIKTAEDLDPTATELRADLDRAPCLRADLIEGDGRGRPSGEIIYYEESHRRALDLYRNSVVHFLATPSFLARDVLRGATEKELRENLLAWQDLFYQEYFVPRDDPAVASAELFLDHFAAQGWTERRAGQVVATPEGEAILTCLAAQTRGLIEVYESVCRVVLDLSEPVTRKQLLAQAERSYANAQLLGEARHTEAASATTFGNVLDLLVRRGILVTLRVPRKAGAPELRYAPGENGAELIPLQERLASTLVAG